MRMQRVWNHPTRALKTLWHFLLGLARAWRGALAGMLLLAALSTRAQVYSINAGDIVAANFREGGSTVVRVNPQTGAVRRVGVFTSPTDVTISPDGYLYVSELSGLIKRVNLTNGVQTTVNPGTTLSQVWGLALGPQGDLFVTTSVSDRVVRVNPTTGSEINVAQGGQIATPTGIDFLDPDHVVVASRGNDRVVSVSLLDQTQTVLARGADGMNQPWGISVYDTNIYVGAQDSRMLFRITGTNVTNILPAWSPQLGGGPYGIGTGTNGDIVVGVSGGLVGPFALERRDPQGNPLPNFSGNYIGEITGVEVSRISVLAESQTNTPPQLAAIGELMADEGVAMAFAAAATDSDWPLQELTFSLVGEVAPGASVSANGVFTWKPTEAQGPATNRFTLVVTDDGTPALSSTQTVTVVVREVNTAPIVTPVGTKPAAVGTLLSFKVTATDADLPSQTLTFSLEPVPPLGASITTNGDFTWTPGAIPGPGDYTIGVIVTDSAGPPMSGTNRFIVQVREANGAPVFVNLTNRTVNESTLLSFQLTATDSDQPPQVLTYGLAAAAPAGVAVSSSGIFTWTPTEAQGPITTNIAVRVTDNGTPPLSTTGSVSVIVNEVNRSPTLTAITNQIIYFGQSVAFTAAAQDADLPAQGLTFTLGPGAPDGATISPAGVFGWLPVVGQAPGSNTITVTVTDNGSPPLSASRTFGVDVRGGYVLSPGDIVVADYGANSVVKIDGQSGAPQMLGGFTSPTDVAVSANGAVYVSEQGGSIKRLELQTGIISVVNPGSSLSNVRSLAIGPDGDLYVAAAGNNSIVRITPATGVTTAVTQGGLIAGPYGIAMLDTNHLLVSSFNNNSLVVVALTNNTQYLAAPTNGISQPWGVAVSDGQTNFSSYGTRMLQTLSNGVVSSLTTLVDRPVGIAMANNGDLFVSVYNGTTSRISSFSPGGSPLATYTSGLSGLCMGLEVVTSQLNRPPVPGTNVISRFAGGGTKVRQSRVLGTDPDGDVITFQSVSATSVEGGTVSTNLSWIFYTPPPGFTNNDSFTYTVRDSRGATAVGTLQIKVAVDNAATSNLVTRDLGNGSILLRFSGIPDAAYLIQYSTDLVTPAWQTLGSTVASGFGIFEFVDTPPGGLTRLYRSVLP